MKQFAFRFQSVLEVRERREKTEEEALALRHADRDAARAELGRLEAGRQAALESQVEHQQAASIDLQTVMLFQGYLKGLDHQLDDQRVALEQAQQLVERQREVLLAARRDAEVMRKLRERDEREWRLAIDRAEAAFLDELATIKYARRDRT